MKRLAKIGTVLFAIISVVAGVTLIIAGLLAIGEDRAPGYLALGFISIQSASYWMEKVTKKAMAESNSTFREHTLECQRLNIEIMKSYADRLKKVEVQNARLVGALTAIANGLTAEAATSINYNRIVEQFTKPVEKPSVRPGDTNPDADDEFDGDPIETKASG